MTSVKIDLNKATAKDLLALNGIGSELAERIIQHRPYKAVSDLKRLKGIGDFVLAKLSPFVTVVARSRVKAKGVACRVDSLV
jgi:competence protein ComEA